MTGLLPFEEWLDDRLHEKGWSQAAFAEAVGVARQTVSSWINGVQPPRRRIARDIARVLGLTEDEVLVRMGYPPRDPAYRLPEDREPEPAGSIDLNDPRTRFFASKAGELSEEDWEVVKRVIEGLASNPRDDEHT